MTPLPIIIAQGYNLLQPKTGRAYPVPCDEWKLLKRKLKSVSGAPFLFHTLGSGLIGITLAMVVTLLTDALPSGEKNRIIAWAILAVSGVAGGLFLWFAKKHQDIYKSQVNDVIAQMDIIELRYPNEDTGKEASAADSISIIEGKYGSGAQVSDVTQILKRHVTGGRLKLIVENAAFGDPCVGQNKSLKVIYMIRDQRVVVEVKEGETIEIP